MPEQIYSGVRTGTQYVLYIRVLSTVQVQYIRVYSVYRQELGIIYWPVVHTCTRTESTYGILYLRRVRRTSIVYRYGHTILVLCRTVQVQVAATVQVLYCT